MKHFFRPIYLILIVIIIVGYGISIAINNISDGYRIAPGVTKIKNYANACYILTSSNPKDIFVPTRDITSWNSFVSSAPRLGVSVSQCKYTRTTNNTYWAIYSVWTTVNLGTHHKCILRDYYCDSDWDECKCIITGTTDGAWSMYIEDEGGRHPGGCSVECSDEGTIGSLTDGADCTDGFGRSGINIGGTCCAGNASSGPWNNIRGPSENYFTPSHSCP